VIDPVRRSPSYVPSFNLIIPPSKDAALTFANLTNTSVPVRVYSDGSGFKGGIGMSALLYINDRLARTLRFYLGSPTEHTIYEAKGVGLLMGLHLLTGLSRQLTAPTILGSDSQAPIRALGNQSAHSGQYLLNAIHLAAERLHSKQDGLINRAERQWLLEAGKSWKGRCKGIVDLQVHWVPGHKNFEPNERANKEAKLAAQGHSSDAKFLPPLLHKRLPLSILALCQSYSESLKKRWRRR
jgi:ribonuclease HI